VHALAHENHDTAWKTKTQHGKPRQSYASFQAISKD